MTLVTTKRAADYLRQLASTGASSRLILVQNWFEELRRLVPTN